MRIFKNRTLPAGDPSRFVVWRWMDILGGPEKSLYLRRLYVLRTPLGGLMIHWIHRPDWSREALHDHPWGLTKRSSFWAFIVRGGYTEQIQTMGQDEIRTLTHKAGRWHGFPIGDVHRIDAVKSGTVTLVISGRKRFGWGFWVDGKIVPWREYVDDFGQDGAR